VSRSESLHFELHPLAQPMSADERRRRLQNPGFGRVFSEHQVTIRYVVGRGWHDARLEPYAPLQLWPSASSLHYGQAIFEGFKAYRQQDDGIATFRPDANAARFNRSAIRLAMPELPAEWFVQAADLLIAQGPQLRFPHSSGINNSRHSHMRELRIQSEGRPLRIFYAFDPARQAVLLIGGDKTGEKRFYESMIPVAERLWKEYLDETAKVE